VQLAVIEMDHQINAETLRKYLPEEENRQELVLRTPTQNTGKDYSHEIGILYNMVMQNKKDLEDLKALLNNNSRNTDEAPVRNLEISKPRDLEEIPSRETEDILPIEEDNLRIEEGEKERIRKALELSGGNRKVAAQKVGLSERTLYRKIKEYGL
jgi:DNA-binding NtrC family response regulator